jgi:anaerobic ribonucleoside-triphosphate reductase activating protein
MKLRVHNFLKCSFANGPGARAVIWVQGCPLHCPGCFNPDTHNFKSGNWVETMSLAHEILDLSHQIQGVTISGGETLAQPEALSELLATLRDQSSLSVILFTGYSWSEMLSLPGFSPLDSLTGMPPLLRCVDVILAGRYDHRQHLASGLRGSANKTVHFLTNRYSPFDFASVPPAEIILERNGRIIRSGIALIDLQLEPTTSIGDCYE